jgi:hypothetical protein
MIHKQKNHIVHTALHHAMLLSVPGTDRRKQKEAALQQAARQPPLIFFYIGMALSSEPVQA